MKVLIIEDHEGITNALQQQLENGVGTNHVDIATSLQSANEFLTAGPYDLVICDRKLPKEEGSLELSEEFGDQIVGRIAADYPGTPVFVLTGLASIEIVEKYLHDGRNGDCFGTRIPRPMVRHFRKAKLSECLSAISDFEREIKTLDEIEIVADGFPDGRKLRRTEQRVIRLFARNLGGTVARIKPIGGGLSEARTCKVKIEDDRGGTRANTFAKLGRLNVLAREQYAYSQYLPGSLRPSAFAPMAGEVKVGAGDVGGLFYTLADTYTTTLYQRLLANPEEAAELINTLALQVDGWTASRTRKQLTVKEIRRFLISDETAEKIARTIDFREWESFEARTVPANCCPQHCDLHGHNVLTSFDDDVILIDYSDITEVTASLDFIILELSLLFHPVNVLGTGVWPTLDNAANWEDVEKFTAGSDIAPYISACRRHAIHVSAGPREIYAGVYAYTLRQFKYADTDKAIASRILQSAIRAFNDT